ERRHAVRAALADRLHDLLNRGTVNPAIIDEWRPRAAAAIAMAAGAVEPREQLLPLGQVIGVVLVVATLPAGRRDRLIGAGRERRERDRLAGFGRDRVRAVVALLALAARGGGEEEEEEQGRALHGRA